MLKQCGIALAHFQRDPRGSSMQIAEAIADARVHDASGQDTYSLRAGHRYLVYDSEAGYGLRDGALKLVGGLDSALPSYNREPLEQQRLILPFIGRRGDAVVVASCLAALKEQYSAITIDIAAPQAAREVLRLMPRVGELLPYPLDVERLTDYDYYLSFEEIEAIPRGWRRSYAEVFSACLRTPRPAGPPHVAIPPEVAKRWVLPPVDRARVAVHFRCSDGLRSYPRELLEKVTRGLVDAGFEIYLTGTPEQTGHASAYDSDHVHDLAGRTPTVGDLAAVMSQMDVLLTGDSFPMHLAGALAIPTIALFTTTDAVIGSDYASVVAVQSLADCSPCRIAEGTCPLGHGECIAHHDPSLDPETLVERVRSLVEVSV